MSSRVPQTSLIAMCAFCAGAAAACAIGDIADVASRRAELAAELRRERAAAIRDAAESDGLTNPLVLVGIANHETGLAHCWSEATWACPGPTSADCDGGPILAGGADGPCADRQGGLGVFQFDAGTYAQTLARDGDGVLTLEGSTHAAVRFVLRIVERSEYIDGVETAEDALGWLNELRPWHWDGWDAWLSTLAHYYNGCAPDRCAAHAAKRERYGAHAIELIDEMGAEFWFGRDAACGPIPASGAVIDETDGCFGAGGDPAHWRTTSAGYDASALWTYTTDHDTAINSAFYRLRFEAPGRYDLEAYIPTSVAQSESAQYVVHADTDETVVVNQRTSSGWTLLRAFDFARAGQITIGDNTGEPNALGRSLCVDALRLTPKGEQTDSNAGPAPLTPSVDVLTRPAASRRSETHPVEGGCSVLGPVRLALAASTHIAAAFLVMVIIVRTHRRTRTKGAHGVRPPCAPGSVR